MADQIAFRFSWVPFVVFGYSLSFSIIRVLLSSCIRWHVAHRCILASFLIDRSTLSTREINSMSEMSIFMKNQRGVLMAFLCFYPSNFLLFFVCFILPFSLFSCCGEKHPPLCLRPDASRCSTMLTDAPPPTESMS